MAEAQDANGDWAEQIARLLVGKPYDAIAEALRHAEATGYTFGCESTAKAAPIAFPTQTDEAPEALDDNDGARSFDAAIAEAANHFAAELKALGGPPSPELTLALGVGAGVRAAYKQLMPEIGDAREELSRLKCEASQRAVLEEFGTRYGGGVVKCVIGSRADIDLVERWHNGFNRADYLAERLDLYLNEAQRLAALVYSLGGNPEPEKRA